MWVVVCMIEYLHRRPSSARSRVAPALGPPVRPSASEGPDSAKKEATSHPRAKKPDPPPRS